MDSFYIPPGSVAEPEHPRPTPSPEADPAGGERVEWSADLDSKAPLFNLLKPRELGAPELVPAATAKAAEAGGAETAKGRRKRWPVLAVAAGLLLLGGDAGVYVVLLRKPAPVAQVTPTLSPTPSPSPSATPSPSPTPTPAATPEPETVTAPAVAPTAEHPQAVTITSKSGLWLRSSATSIDRSNIIGWMPDGSTISVDQVGDFWWHGVYKGQAGYFASKYTQ